MSITKKLFVSYTLKDKVLTIEHLRRLKTQVSLSYDTYIDILDNDSHDKQQRVDNELVKCDELYVIDTPLVRESNWVNYELTQFHLLGKPIGSIDPQSIDITSKRPIMRHKVFIIYHCVNDQWAKDRLIELNRQFDFFIEASVDTGNFFDEFDDQKMYQEMHDKCPNNSKVAILLLGTDTQYRKFSDWKLLNSYIRRCHGIVAIMLPDNRSKSYHTTYGNKQKVILPIVNDRKSVDYYLEPKSQLINMPACVIDKPKNKGTKVSIVNWNDLNIDKLTLLIDNAANY